MKLQMQREDAHDTIILLGHTGVVQFNDVNPTGSPLHRAYTPHLRRCDDIERRLQYFREQIAEMPVPREHSPVDESVSIKSYQLKKGMLEILEVQLERIEQELREITSRYGVMLGEMNKQREMREVFSQEDSFYWGESCSMNDRSNENRPETTLFLIVGVIPSSSVYMLEKLTYRITRGNSYIRTAAIAEPFIDQTSSAEVNKSVFAIFFAASLFYPKIMKVCESLDGHVYPYADLDRSKVLPEVITQCETMTQAIQKTQLARNELLQSISPHISTWARLVRAEKSVFEVLNRIDFNGMIAIADVWIPQCEIERIEAALHEADLLTNAQVSSILTLVENDRESHCHSKSDALKTPPTYFRTNKYTVVFQDIIESYGIARYREINPAVLSATTFPYLFGIMYGDLGHGLIMTFAAMGLIAFEARLAGSQNEIFNTVFQGRYLIFLMGAYSCYTGLLYNDTFGISTDIFSSGYIWGSISSTSGKIMTPVEPSGLGVGLNTAPGRVAAFGIDAAWAETENKLEFYNSIKMKCAIVIGVIQMIAGLVLSLMNHIHFGDWRRVFFQFIPEIVFLLCTFGYMAILIVLKWCTPFASTNDAPSLLETMTNFFLAPGSVTQQLYRGQAGVQMILLFIALLMIPTLLIPIPYLAWRDKRRKTLNARANPKIDSFLDNSNCGSHGNVYENSDQGTDSAGADEVDLSEIIIHQVIHTIEFVLGSVSNTASYLRLWALSLAHAELSDVFWNFTLLKAISAESGHGIVVFIGIAVWLIVSIFVLLLMESLSAFLHTLRLHWVEFQNKFYYGDGTKFLPFDLNSI